MSVIATEMVMKKSVVSVDGNTNGGVASVNTVNSGVRHGIFPRVTRAERTNGLTRYRKVHVANVNNMLDTAYGVLVYLTYPSPAGDRFLLGAGTHDDTQQDMIASPPAWIGCGKLNAGASAGATTIDLLMEGTDFVFPRNGWFHISSNYKTGQTAAAGVTAGQSVTFNAGTWNAAGHNGDTAYPNGIWLGDGNVQTDDGTGHEEWLRIADIVTPYSYVGNVCTITLADPLTNSYTTTATWGSGCVGGADAVALIDTLSKSSTGGVYDNVTKPIIADNKGTVEDDIHVTFTGSGVFSVAGVRLGNLGSGSVSSAFSPINPDTGTPYFTIPVGFFTGSWLNTDTMNFSTHPASLPIWIKEVVPPGVGQFANNVFCLGWYWE